MPDPQIRFGNGIGDRVSRTVRESIRNGDQVAPTLLHRTLSDVVNGIIHHHAFEGEIEIIVFGIFIRGIGDGRKGKCHRLSGPIQFKR